MDPRIAKLTRNLRQVPDNKPVVYFLTQALRSTGELHMIAVLMECWMSVSQGARPDLTLVTLYWRQALVCSGDRARVAALALLRVASLDRLFVSSKRRLRSHSGVAAS